MFAVDYTEVIIVGSDKTAGGIAAPDDQFDTWGEARDSLIDYYEKIIADARQSIKEAKKLKEN